MANVFDLVRTYGGNGGSYGPQDASAWQKGNCPNCGAVSFGTVARQKQDPRATTYVPTVLWLACPTCNHGFVMDDGRLYPSAAPLSTPEGLPEQEQRVWEEVRQCLGIGAYTAAVMLCRKLIMHVAVVEGLPAKNAKDRAPSFEECVDHLEQEGVVTKRMKDWVDRIRLVGNTANHELDPVGKDAAMDVATFTQQLLRLAFELDYKNAAFNPSAAGAGESAVALRI